MTRRESSLRRYCRVMSKLTRRIAASRYARAAAFPSRTLAVTRNDAAVVGRSARWLFTSREHTNFTYDLTARNLEHLAWWVAAITGADVAAVRTYIRELNNDEELRGHVLTETAKSDRWRLADPEVRFGRRAGWYALTRVLQPEHVVETGTDKGLGACAFAAALLRNGHGRLTTMDVNPDSGYLLRGRYAEVTDHVLGNSLDLLESQDSPVDLFIHDSLHTFEHETAEFEAVAPRLSPGAVVLSDNAHDSDALPRWAEASRRRFLYFREVPEQHWLPGEGIGAAW